MDGVQVSKIRVSPTGLVTRKAAADALVRSPKTLCEWAAKGTGPKPRKIGGRIFYDWEDVLKFASGQS
jgi:hypothetical protein